MRPPDRLIAARREPGARFGVLSYGHGDVVRGYAPQWKAGLDPWRLQVDGDRWYGRGTADNKGQHTVNLLGLASAIHARQGRLGYNVTVLMETGEEAGSPGLREFCESRPALLWDGEWEITWVTFRDMGGAFLVALLGIYILVVAQFGSFKLPLVILTPIPLTLIGIMLGHWLFHAAFTATSMIGFIALAGIIVRNSILLVDFIRHSQTEGRPLREVLLEAGAIRFKPSNPNTPS